MLAAFLLAGCNNPARPSDTVPIERETAPPLLMHDKPVSMPDGSIAYLCGTQIRQYVVQGELYWERDYYIQPERCPATPID